MPRTKTDWTKSHTSIKVEGKVFNNRADAARYLIKKTDNLHSIAKRLHMTYQSVYAATIGHEDRIKKYRLSRINQMIDAGEPEEKIVNKYKIKLDILHKMIEQKAKQKKGD